MRRKELTGERNGKLVISGPAPSHKGHSHWFATCDCGRVVTVATSNLLKTTSCGCGREDYLLSGEWIGISCHTHGWLMPLGYIRPSTLGQGAYPGKRGGYWLCRCTQCRSWTTATTADLKNGKAVACEDCTSDFKTEQFWRDCWNMPRLLERSSYEAFDAMHRRTRHEYENVEVCERWQMGSAGRANFRKDMGIKPHLGLSLERNDPKGPYSPENCKWDTRPKQDRNKTNSRRFQFQGNVTNLVDFAALLGQAKNLVSKKMNRLNNQGLTDAEAAGLLYEELHMV